MEMGSIGYNHSHDENYVNDRPFGAGTWLFLAIKTKAIFILKGKEFITYDNQCLIYDRSTGRADSWVPSVSDMFAEDWEIVE